MPERDSGRIKRLDVRRVAVWLTLACSWLACQSPPSVTETGDLLETPVVPEAPELPADQFSGARAFSDLKALAGVGPRVSGSRGARKARAVLRDRLEALGAEIEELRFEIAAPGNDDELVGIASLVGVLPGDSSDVILLAAPYDSRVIEHVDFIGANDGASGAALLLELGRALSVRPRPYTVWLVFIGGDGLGAPTSPMEVSSASAAELYPGSNAVARELARRSELERVRVATFFNRVAAADLVIVRDLRSNRAYREVFWKMAVDLGLSGTFAEEAGYESIDSGHRAFMENGLRRVVAIADRHYGREEGRTGDLLAERDTLEDCSPESLGRVGTVALAALDRIALRLSQIDRFAESPLADPSGGREAPDGTGASPTPAGEPASDPAGAGKTSGRSEVDASSPPAEAGP